MHGNRDPADIWRARFARLRAGGISGVLVGGGDTAMLADAAHAEGLTFHAWTWIMNRSGDAWVKANHPEWFNVSRNGDSSLTHPPYVGYYQWLCPTRPEVRAYLRSLVTEVAEIPGVDAVHLDYIRHPDVILPRGLWSKYGLVQDHEMPEYDFCYCDVCRDTFRAQSGYDPLSVADPSADQAWREFRWNSISEVVAILAAAAHAHNRADLGGRLSDAGARPHAGAPGLGHMAARCRLPDDLSPLSRPGHPVDRECGARRARGHSDIGTAVRRPARARSGSGRIG